LTWFGSRPGTRTACRRRPSCSWELISPSREANDLPAGLEDSPRGLGGHYFSLERGTAMRLDRRLVLVALAALLLAPGLASAQFVVAPALGGGFGGGYRFGGGYFGSPIGYGIPTTGY